MERTIQPLANEIAAAMGEGWSVESIDAEDSWRAYLCGPDGARVFVSREWQANGKVTLRGTYPRGFEPRARYSAVQPRDVIGVSESRGATVIAREITRRLLPEYLPALREAFARQGDDGNAAKARAQLGEELAGIVGGTFDADERNSRGRVRLPMHGRWGHVDIHYRAESTTVELHDVSPDLARTILRAVAEHDS